MGVEEEVAVAGGKEVAIGGGGVWTGGLVGRMGLDRSVCGVDIPWIVACSQNSTVVKSSAAVEEEVADMVVG